LTPTQQTESDLNWFRLTMLATRNYLTEFEQATAIITAIFMDHKCWCQNVN